MHENSKNHKNTLKIGDAMTGNSNCLWSVLCSMCLSFHVAVNAHIIYSFFYIYFKLQQHTEGIIDMMQMQVSLDLPFTYDDTVKTLSIFLGE